jgi:hypothetical protein
MGSNYCNQYLAEKEKENLSYGALLPTVGFSGCD